MKYIVVFLLFCTSFHSQAQKTIDSLLDKYNKGTVPYITVQELEANLEDYLILDTRLKEEYELSHLPGAIWVSEKLNDTIYAFAKAKKDKPIVVYCSIGVRSEDFGEALQERGFTQVYNLHGSIFSWKNQGLPIINNTGKLTDSVHTYSKQWEKYLKSGVKVSMKKKHG